MHYNNNMAVSALCCILLFGFTSSAFALDVNIAKDLPSVDTVVGDKVVRIQRIQDQDNVITGGFSKTSRKCPPFCVQPMLVAPGVTTVGELELLNFIKDKMNNGTGVLIDARTPAWYEKSTIPGSVNIPFTTFDKDKSDLVKGVALGKLGVRKVSKQSFVSSMWNSLQKLIGQNNASGKWDFSGAKDILLWCNGMWCGQSPRAIRGLLAIGYPAEKIYYYRGGMQSWQLLGLSVVVPEEN